MRVDTKNLLITNSASDKPKNLNTEPPLNASIKVAYILRLAFIPVVCQSNQLWLTAISKFFLAESGLHQATK